MLIFFSKRTLNCVSQISGPFPSRGTASIPPFIAVTNWTVFLFNRSPCIVRQRMRENKMFNREKNDFRKLIFNFADVYQNLYLSFSIDEQNG
jgi:hypothetical protein